MIADDDGPAQRKMPYGFWKLRRMMAAATPSRIETCKHHGSQHRIYFEGVCGKKWLPAQLASDLMLVWSPLFANQVRIRKRRASIVV